MKILALDTATRTGWALSANGVTDSGVVDCSIRLHPTKNLPGDHPGRRFRLFYIWLRDKLRDDKVDLIVYEAVVGGMAAGGKTSLIQKGLEAIVYLCAERAGQIPVWSFAPSTLKKWAIGSGKLTHESKAAVVEAARKQWSDLKLIPHLATKSAPWKWDDNECDALWLLDLARAVFTYQHTNHDEWATGELDGLDWERLQTEHLTKIANHVTAKKWPSAAKKRSKTK